MHPTQDLGFHIGGFFLLVIIPTDTLNYSRQ